MHILECTFKFILFLEKELSWKTESIAVGCGLSRFNDSSQFFRIIDSIFFRFDFKWNMSYTGAGGNIWCDRHPLDLVRLNKNVFALDEKSGLSAF